MKKRHRLASSSDVARLAGVSQSAVSRTFSPHGSVSEKTRERVLAAARQLDYRPNALPAIMQGKGSNMVAIVLGGMHNPFYARVLESLTRHLQQRGQQVLVTHVESDHALDGAIEQLMRYRVDAIVSALAVMTPEIAQVLSATHIPVVAFNNLQNAPGVSSVNSDNHEAGQQIAHYFLKQGHRHFCFIHGPEGSPAEQLRFQGFAHVVEKSAVAADKGVTLSEARGHYDYAGGQEAIRSLWVSGQRPTAIFCANDLMALGVMDTLRYDFNVHIPDEVAIVGYDNIESAAWKAYGLSSFDQNVNAMVEGTLALLDEHNDGAPGQVLTIPPVFHERKSSFSVQQASTSIP